MVSLPLSGVGLTLAFIELKFPKTENRGMVRCSSTMGEESFQNWNYSWSTRPIKKYASLALAIFVFNTTTNFKEHFNDCRGHAHSSRWSCSSPDRVSIRVLRQILKWEGTWVLWTSFGSDGLFGENQDLPWPNKKRLLLKEIALSYPFRDSNPKPTP